MFRTFSIKIKLFIYFKKNLAHRELVTSSPGNASAREGDDQDAHIIKLHCFSAFENYFWNVSNIFHKKYSFHKKNLFELFSFGFFCEIFWKKIQKKLKKYINPLDCRGVEKKSGCFLEYLRKFRCGTLTFRFFFCLRSAPDFFKFFIFYFSKFVGSPRGRKKSGRFLEYLRKIRYGTFFWKIFFEMFRNFSTKNI